MFHVKHFVKFCGEGEDGGAGPQGRRPQAAAGGAAGAPKTRPEDGLPCGPDTCGGQGPAKSGARILCKGKAGPGCGPAQKVREGKLFVADKFLDQGAWGDQLGADGEEMAVALQQALHRFTVFPGVLYLLQQAGDDGAV